MQLTGNKGLVVGLEASKEAVFVYVFEATFGLSTPRRHERKEEMNLLRERERRLRKRIAFSFDLIKIRFDFFLGYAAFNFACTPVTKRT